MLQFQSFNSVVDPSFWQRLADEKLNRLRLDESAVAITCYYQSPSTASNTAAGFCLMHAVPSSFNSAETQTALLPPNSCHSPTQLLNFNTITAFKDADKPVLLKEHAHKHLWQPICNGRAIEEPYILNSVLLLTYADLKRHRFYYWFAFPILLHPRAVSARLQGSPQPIDSVIPTETGRLSLLEQYRSLLNGNVKCGGYFAVRVFSDGRAPVVMSLEKALSNTPQEEFEQGNILLAFTDPCTAPNTPGWTLRNLLVLFCSKLKQCSRVKVLAYRPIRGTMDAGQSAVFDLTFPTSSNSDDAMPDVVGWEKHSNGKYTPRLVDLSGTMDPLKLAETTADLNLKLMKWRQVPSLDLDAIQSKRYLLIGAGTLGCFAARCLMGWGVKNMTFVDNGLVSHSNILRQPLFEFADYQKPKASSAAAAVKRIFPAMKCEAVEMTVPMPGHSADNPAVIQAAVEKLKELFQSHDVIILGTDTRESRWLPTVLGNVYRKIVVNIALGFDSYLVMRHGLQPLDKGEHLGCYFCNDIYAPADSTRDRTLDQECTVTRPGLAPMAAACGVELLVSMLQHPLGPLAPSTTDASCSETSNLGLLPHQIRYYLSRYQSILITGQHFPNCSGCSPAVIEAYRSEGSQFVQRVVGDVKYLETVCGLSEVKSGLDDLKVDWDDSDEEYIVD